MKGSLLSRCFSFWKSAGLDADTLLKMMKGALPPTIVAAMYEPAEIPSSGTEHVSSYRADAVSDLTGTVGYLTSVMAIISQCLLPRGKFLKIMLFIVLSTCASASICCLAVFSAVKARDHTNSANDVARIL